MFVHIDDEISFLPNVLQGKTVVKFLNQMLLFPPQKLILLVPHFIINIICYHIHSHPYPHPLICTRTGLKINNIISTLSMPG